MSINCSPVSTENTRQQKSVSAYAIRLTQIQRVSLAIMSLLSVILAITGGAILLSALLCSPLAIVSLALAGVCLASGLGMAAFTVASYYKYKQENIRASRLAFRDLLEELQRERAIIRERARCCRQILCPESCS